MQVETRMQEDERETKDEKPHKKKNIGSFYESFVLTINVKNASSLHATCIFNGCKYYSLYAYFQPYPKYSIYAFPYDFQRMELFNLY
jgi:hypothetical protein